MATRDPETRREYMRNYMYERRCGMKRTDESGKQYIDDATVELLRSERAFRARQRQRALAKRQRRFAREERTQTLLREVAELRVRPFYSTEWER